MCVLVQAWSVEVDLDGWKGWIWYGRSLWIWKLAGIGPSGSQRLVVTPAELASLDQATGCGTLARSGRLGRVLQGKARQTQWETLEKDVQDLAGWRSCSFKFTLLETNRVYRELH